MAQQKDYWQPLEALKGKHKKDDQNLTAHSMPKITLSEGAGCMPDMSNLPGQQNDKTTGRGSAQNRLGIAQAVSRRD